MKPTLEERADALAEFFAGMDDQEIITAYSGVDLEVPCEGGVLKGYFAVYDDGHYFIGDNADTYDAHDLRDFLIVAMDNFTAGATFEEK